MEISGTDNRARDLFVDCSCTMQGSVTTKNAAREDFKKKIAILSFRISNLGTSAVFPQERKSNWERKFVAQGSAEFRSLNLIGQEQVFEVHRPLPMRFQ